MDLRGDCRFRVKNMVKALFFIFILSTQVGCENNKIKPENALSIKEFSGYIVLDFEEMVLYSSRENKENPTLRLNTYENATWLDVSLPKNKTKPFKGKVTGEIIVGGRNGHLGMYGSIIKNAKVYNNSGELVAKSEEK